MKVHKLKRWSWVVLGICTLGFSACDKKEKKEGGAPAGPMMGGPQAVEVAPVVARNMVDAVSLTGNLLPNESTEIRPELAGVIREIGFEEGQRVKKGQVMIELDTRELEAQLMQSKAQLELAKRNLERARSLLSSKAIAQAEVDSCEADERRLAAEVRLLEVRIDKSSLRAPFNGIAGARDLSLGDYVTSASMVTRVEDISQIKIQVDVPETFLSRIKMGTTLKVEVEGKKDALSGHVYFISPRVNENTRAAEVKGIIENSDESIRPGMFANVRVVLEEKSQVLTVPESALMAAGKGMAVVVIRKKDGKKLAEFVPIKVGLRQPGIVEVSPLKPGQLKVGDEIVSTGVGSLIIIPGMELTTVVSERAGKAPTKTDRQIEVSQPAK